MASQSKSDAARANGSKSRGPTTPEGKARSSKNALKHGLTAQLDTLPGESQEDFQTLLESHMTQYQPVGALEEDLVQTLAITRWRLRRIPALEFSILDNETVLLKEDIDGAFSEIGNAGRLGFAFRKLADNSKALALLIRYETSLTRTHDRVFKHLIAVQKLRNEPKPAPGPPTAEIEDSQEIATTFLEPRLTGAVNSDTVEITGRHSIMNSTGVAPRLHDKLIA
jgi:hypothetical protein